MQFGVLGPVEVRVGDVPVDLGGPRQQLIVAGLLFHAGRVVTVADQRNTAHALFRACGLSGQAAARAAGLTHVVTVP
ncbi:hypothetical protein ACFPIJ_48440 [Dactylosporangium cerinum]|uniref:Uncharacterized protein n=1 Tax=Dactylosporangium cerinum TaxID=1434730 RepID=A0ABV9WDW0_9ACTN